jgi:hypothetical protein
MTRGVEENWRVNADNLVVEAFLLAVDNNILPSVALNAFFERKCQGDLLTAKML